MRPIAIVGAIFVFVVTFFVVDFFAMRMVEGLSWWVVAGATVLSGLIALAAALSSYGSIIKKGR